MGGLLIDHASWQWIFWAGAIMAGGAALGTLRVPASGRRTPGRIDVPGALLLAAGLAALLLALTKTATWGWGDARTLGLIAAGLLVLVLFGLYERRAAEPLVNMSVFGRPVLATNLTTMLVGTGMFGAFVLIPQIAQTPKSSGYGFGVDATGAGLLLLPACLMVARRRAALREAHRPLQPQGAARGRCAGRGPGPDRLGSRTSVKGASYVLRPDRIDHAGLVGPARGRPAEPRTHHRRRHRGLLGAGPGATVPAVAAGAGVGKATVYRSYPTKADLIAAVAEPQARWLERRVTDAVEEQDAYAALSELLRDIAVRLSSDRLFVEVLPKADFRNLAKKFTAQMEGLVEAAKQQGRLRSDITYQDVRVLDGRLLPRTH